MIRGHRSYITEWIKNALKSSEPGEALPLAESGPRLGPSASLPAGEHHATQPEVGEAEIEDGDEEIIGDSEDEVYADEECDDVNFDGGRVEDASKDYLGIQDQAIQTEGMQVTDQILVDSRPAPPPPPSLTGEWPASTVTYNERRSKETVPLPGYVALSNSQLKQYICAACRNPWKRRVSTWFELLEHAHKLHGKNDAKLTSRSRAFQGNIEADNGTRLSVNKPRSFNSVDHDIQNELNHMLTVLAKALREGLVSPEVPQLMYDLYYSRSCIFEAWYEKFESPIENR